MCTTSLKVLLTALFANVALGAVQVAVVEVGHPKGTLHSTTTADDAESNNVSLSQLASFWNTVHGNSGASSSLSLGTAGFPVVPDLFHRPEGGLVLGLGQRRPHHEQLNLEGTVATLDISGLSTTQVLKHVEPTPFTMDEAHFFEESSSNYLSTKLTGFEVQDYCIHKAIAQLHEQAVRENQTYVIYVVYDTDDDDSSTRRRRLQEEDGEGGEGEGEDNHEGEEGGEQEGGSQDQQQQEGEGGEQANNKQYGYGYGYGYYNAYGEFVSKQQVLTMRMCFEFDEHKLFPSSPSTHLSHTSSSILSLFLLTYMTFFFVRSPTTRPCSRFNIPTLCSGRRLCW